MSRILLENYYLPGDLEAQIEAFVDGGSYRDRSSRVFYQDDAVLRALDMRSAEN